MTDGGAAPRLAVVGLDRQLHVVTADGRGRRQVTYPQVTSALMRWGGTSGGDACAWPTFSPDGRRLAFFRSRPGQDDQPDVRVAVLEVDGLEEAELDRIDAGLPLYARWSPDGAAVALLVQQDDQLELRVCRPTELGVHRVVDEGPPLFFSWLSDSHRLVLHAGGASGSRLVVRDPLGGGEDVALPGPPGTFCTPMVVGEHLVTAVRRGRASAIVRTDAEGEHPLVLYEAEGLLAFVPSPDGAWLAVSNAAIDRAPYAGVSRVPLDGGAPEVLATEPCMAFFWLPDGQGILTVGVDEPGKRLWWNLHIVATGDRRVVGPFRPTRELLFHLHFFEQFVQSHPLVSADGRFLAYATYAGAAEGPDTPAGKPRIEVIDLAAAEASPVAVAEGRYATFAPPPGPR